MIEIQLLLLFMIAAAVIAVEAKDLLSSVIAIGAVGMGLALAFLVMKAPDLAMMQLVVEILSLIILIRATVRKDLPFSASGRWVFNTVSTAIFITIFLGLICFLLKDIQQFGSPLMRVSRAYITEGSIRTGMYNVVTAIMTNFRALDTLGEVTAVFAAVISVLTIARKTVRKEK